MKPQNRIKNRLTFPANRDHIVKRIRIITRELENIQAEIYGRLGEGFEPDMGGFGHDHVSARALGQFRAVLDQLRNMLWFCAEGNGEGAARTNGLHREHQLAQATAMLRALAPTGSGPSSLLASPSTMNELRPQGPISFFDRLDQVIDNYVEGGGTLLEPRRSQKT
jgi:hypothetical protein